jgi:ribulose 1,5-bisphosphate carboxylase large subunit-like protein
MVLFSQSIFGKELCYAVGGEVMSHTQNPANEKLTNSNNE